MDFSSINYLAVLVAAAVAFILGFLFHGPILGKVWMKLADIHPTGNEKLSDMIPQMIWNFLSNIVTALGLSIVYSWASSVPSMQEMGVWVGVMSGIVVWAGFIVTSTSMDVIWMGKKRGLWLFECGCSLVVMMVMGAIIASM